MKNFKLWFENLEKKPSVFLDLDETLVKTRIVSPNEKTMPEDKVFKYDSDSYATTLRPHAVNFINELKQKADVYIFTHGKQKFQEKVIKLHNLSIDKNHIFGREKYDKIPKFSNFILVDDLELSTAGAQDKLNALGSFPEYDKENFKYKPINNFIKIKPFFGDPNDNELLNVLPKILERLNA